MGWTVVVFEICFGYMASLENQEYSVRCLIVPPYLSHSWSLHRGTSPKSGPLMMHNKYHQRSVYTVLLLVRHCYYSNSDPLFIPAKRCTEVFGTGYILQGPQDACRVTLSNAALGLGIIWINLILHGLFANQILVWQLRQFWAENFVQELICLKSEAFSNQGSTVQ